MSAKDLIARLESLKLGMALVLRPYSRKVQDEFYNSGRRETLSVDDLRAVTDTIEHLKGNSSSSLTLMDPIIDWGVLP